MRGDKKKEKNKRVYLRLHLLSQACKCVSVCERGGPRDGCTPIPEESAVPAPELRARVGARVAGGRLRIYVHRRRAACDGCFVLLVCVFNAASEFTAE